VRYMGRLGYLGLGMLTVGVVVDNTFSDFAGVVQTVQQVGGKVVAVLGLGYCISVATHGL
jgi:hypothetical protein